MINKIFRRLKSTWTKFINEKLPFRIHKSRRLATLYYALFHNGFSREASAVLSGKAKHIEDAKKSKKNYFLLVRNTHRLEKGLLMRPMRKVFAKEYIRETVDSFIGVMSDKEIADTKQKKWFFDVLDEYFSQVGSDVKIDKEKQRFLSFKQNLGQQLLKSSIPYNRDPKDFADISYEEFFKLNRQRRSVRWFLDKEVPRVLIDNAILAAIQAPSACNRQPFEYRIFDDPELVKEAVELPMGTRGYAHSIKVFIVVVGNLDAYFDERDRHLIYIDASLANMSLMLALETLGLASCPINWPDIEERELKMADFLKLEPYQRPIMCIGVGYPDTEGQVAFSEKRDLNLIRKYN